MENKINEIFQSPAYIHKIETLEDGSLKLTLYTSIELKPEEEQMLFRLRKRQGYFLFKDNEIEQEDLNSLPKCDDIKNIYDLKKSPSQWLRDILYVYFMQNGGKKENFNNYYVREITRLGESYKSKLI